MWGQEFGTYEQQDAFYSYNYSEEEESEDWYTPAQGERGADRG